VLADRGAVSKAEADARADAEYELFAVHRRALLEAEGERWRQSALEEAARGLPDRAGREKPEG